MYMQIHIEVSILCKLICRFIFRGQAR